MGTGRWVLAALRGYVADLRGEVASLRAQLAQRSWELADERERSDILPREALGRIGAPGPGEPTGDDPPQPAAPAAPEGQHATIRAGTSQAARAWWRRLLGLEG
ncbi:MAG: hypothetical protein M3462_07290 [Chloroflexota bacterium]|nr:hypothetical protein [Chloroflexota bacterium]